VGATTTRTERAISLFAALGPHYDHAARVLSLGQDPRWRRFLVSRVPATRDERVLDVATGTCAVAIELVRSAGCSVVGVDQSPEMLAAGRRRLEEAGCTDRVELVAASAEELPFGDATFDHLTFTYLLRYVDDPAATMRELARVVRVGGTVAMLEFGVPTGLLSRATWELYVQALLPAFGLAVGRPWWTVGRFLRGSIADLYDRYPLAELLSLWREAGIEAPRARMLSLGGGVVLWGTRGQL
jgi:demethylmenaquinone methyltransferase / 2-methoxy-6-polyprenyl-1,4-benzoquinol methylase